MKWNTNRYRYLVIPLAILMVLLLLVSSCAEQPSASQTSGTLTLMQPSSSSPETSPPSTEHPASTHMKATTLEEASQITGYKVVGPGTIPGGFSNNNIIDIIKTENNDRITYQIMQRWLWDEDPSIFFNLTQNPEIDGIISGSPEQIGNWPGQKRLYLPTGEKPGRLELYWKTEDMAFVLYGIFGGPLDENTLYNIALSIDGG